MLHLFLAPARAFEARAGALTDVTRMVSKGLHRDTPMARDGLVNDAIVLDEGIHHRRWRLLPKPGAPLDVGEQERDDTIGQVLHPPRCYAVGPRR